MTSLKTSIKTITYLSDIGCLEIQGASLVTMTAMLFMQMDKIQQLILMGIQLLQPEHAHSLLMLAMVVW
ncbi:response regulator [Escherichia coli]|nr:response regulator [Escherichia coli]